MKENRGSSGVGFTSLLQIAFIVLKLTLDSLFDGIPLASVSNARCKSLPTAFRKGEE